MKRSLLMVGLFIVSIALLGFLTGCGAAKPPNASITSPSNNSTSTVGQAITFNGAAKDDKGTAIKDAQYLWDFGDGGTDKTQNPPHTYTKPGAYTVTLTVRGAKESTASTVKSAQKVTISVTVQSRPPTAGATATPTSGEAPLSVKFDGSASKSPDGTIAKYDWDFGDGAKGTGATASHDYAKPGTYTVTLTVTDNFNATAKTTVTVTVKEAAGSGTTGTPGAGKVWEIKMSSTPDGKNIFDPAVVTVNPGDTIRWTLAGGAHTATAYCKKNGKKTGIPAAAETTTLCFDSGMLVNPGQTYELKIPADAPQGTYAYYCLPHEALGMVGLIVIGKPSDLSADFINSLPGPAKTNIQNYIKQITK